MQPGKSATTTLNKIESQNGGVLKQLIAEADKLYQMGLVQQAADILQQTIEQFPDDNRAQHVFVKMLIDGNRFEDGLDLLQEIPDAEHSLRTLELVGYCQMGLGRLDEAGDTAGRILAVRSDSAPGLNLLGRLYRQQNNMAGAENLYGQAIESEPDYGPALVNLGIVQWDRGQHQAALESIEKGFMSDPTDMTAVTTYHAAVTALGAFDRAAPAFRTAVNQNPYNERLQYLMIDILIQQQKYPAALSEIQRALAVFGLNDGVIDAAKKVKSLSGQGMDKNVDKEECRLSVCMIVKNEAAHLSKCLQSVRPIADEIIVADTDSSDRSKDIAAIFGANVFDFQWEDDFAKARNFALSKASGDWILCLDADEVISPLDYGALRNLVRTSNPRTTAYSIVTRNYINRFNALGWSPNDGQYLDEQAGCGWFPSDKVRLFPNHARIRFEYPVHEIVEPSLNRLGIDIQPCRIPVHHYGKLDARNSAAKGRRYYQIGTKKLAEVEHSAAAIRELAIQAGNLEKYEEAVSLWQRVIGLQPETADAYVNMGTAYWNLGRYNKAVDSARKAINLAPNMKEAHFNYSLGLLHLGKAGAAIPVLESLLAKYPEYFSARFLLAAAQCCAGQTLKGAQGLKRLKQSKLGPGLNISCQTLAEGFRSAGQIDYAQAILDTAAKTAIDSGDVPVLSEGCSVTSN